MVVIVAPAGYRVISAKEAEKRFAVSRDVAYLAAGRSDEAYRVVDRVLTRTPDFADFADRMADPDFQRWRGDHR